MEAEQNTTSELNHIELSSIYKSVTIESNSNFDESDEFQFLEDCVNNCYDEEFKLIETLELQRNINLLNNSFVKFVYYCNQNYKYKNVAKIFLAYCDFFSLDYHEVYIALHEKLQKLIKNGFIKMLGSLKRYTQIKDKLDPSNITTLFDLIANKNE